ncbi:hypothetical protein V2J09_005177 [Rumex salicifolius]
MLALNQILPLPSFPSQKSSIHRPRPAFNYHSVFCGTALKFAHPNLGRKRTPCYSNGNRTNWWTSAPRRCADFRDCGRSVKVRCGVSGGEDDAYYMRRAVERAREAIGCTSPNPMVGCVIVKDGEIVGEGFHPKAGQPHAEVFALRNAGELVEGAIAYVSLEPCNHYGRTPPCSEALIKAKVSKVVVGMVDPNPIVASKGVEKLRAAGIQVVVGIEEDLCKRLNECYIHKMLTGNPFVTLRYTISANGLFLNQLGEEASALGGYYSKLLQEYDAVIQSSVALAEFGFPTSMEPKAIQPRHIVLEKTNDSPISVTNLATAETARNAIIFTEEEAAIEPEAAETGIERVNVDKITMEAVLDYCSKQGSCSVLLDVRGNVVGLEELLKEGVQKNLIQKIVVEMLPVWAGSNEYENPMTSITQGLGLKNFTSIVSGGSVLIEGYF